MAEYADYAAERGFKVAWSPEFGGKVNRKQEAALSCPAFELFYGGAKGGGKTDFLIADFAQGVKYKKAWKGLFFRRTYPELEMILPRVSEIYGAVGAVGRNPFNGLNRDWTFPGGAMIRFRSLERDSDTGRYQGSAPTWVGFDELGNYPTDKPWVTMMGELRSSAGVPVYIRGSGNPGGPGMGWIKHRFIDGAEPMKVRRIAGENGQEVTRCFVPATLDDNPALAIKDPEYASRMKASLPDYLYRMLRYGDWNIIPGQFFDEWRPEAHIVDRVALPQADWRKFYAFDWGGTAPFALVKLAVNRWGRMVQYGEWYGCDVNEYNKGIKMPPREVAQKCWEMAMAEGVTEIIMDPACWNRAYSDVASVGEVFEEAGFTATKGFNERVAGWTELHSRLKTLDQDKTPMLTIARNCVHTIRTLPAMMPDARNLEDVDTNLEDHLVDALRYGVMSEYGAGGAALFAQRVPLRRERSDPLAAWR